MCSLCFHDRQELFTNWRSKIVSHRKDDLGKELIFYKIIRHSESIIGGNNDNIVDSGSGDNGVDNNDIAVTMVLLPIITVTMLLITMI